MYIATKLGDSVDKQTRRRTVTVRFTEGESTFDKDFQFNISETIGAMKRVVKNYLDEINFIAPTFEDGVIDVSDISNPSPDAPTQAELDKQEWQRNRELLRTLMELVRDGVFTGSENQITNLKAKVKADFKPAYLE